MAESYCGKSCAECSYKQEKQCLGCKIGPGSRCDIGRCVMGKGHITCQTCTNLNHCGIYRGRERAMEYRNRAEEAELRRQEEIQTRTKGLYKVFFLLFWLSIISQIGSVMNKDLLAPQFLVLVTVWQFIYLILSIVYGGALLCQYKRNGNYLISGVLWISAAVLRFAGEYFAAPDGKFTIATIIGFFAGVIQVVAIFKELQAYSDALMGIEDLADKWQGLWYWMLGSYCASLAGIVLIIISPILGMLAMIAGGIAIIVVSIVKMTYLYRSGKICRYYEKFDEYE